MTSEQMLSGTWWKFDRYEIRDGFIRPVAGAELRTYDPWRAYAESQRTTKREPPYTSLLKLVSLLGGDRSTESPLFAIALHPNTEEYDRATAEAQRWDEFDEHWFADQIEAQMMVDYYHHVDVDEGLDFEESVNQLEGIVSRAGIGLNPLKIVGHVFEPGPTELVRLRKMCPLPPNTEEQVAAWCSQHGLLGLLPHIAESITLAAQWTVGEGWNPELRFKGRTLEHYRCSGQWRTRRVDCYFEEEADLGTPEEGVLIPSSPAYRPRCPGARTRHIEKYGLGPTGLSEESLLETWCDFFPTIDDKEKLTYRYPRPLTEEFWQIYAEPLEMFLRHALIFRYAVSSDLQRLETLLEPIGLAARREPDGRIVEHWSCPSLLSIFAKMAQQDLAGGTRILRCPACGLPFAASAHQAVYCSQTCAWRHRKRRRRLAKNADPKGSSYPKGSS